MTTFDTSNPSFNALLRMMETTDKGHANLFNDLFGKLINNDVFLKAYVDQKITDLLNGAPGALDTLNELAAALGDDSNFAITIINLINNKTAMINDALEISVIMKGV